MQLLVDEEWHSLQSLAETLRLPESKLKTISMLTFTVALSI
ncbi:MAG TPA: hypothetical protein VE955_03855 [Candidatus Dormibacteraeota bacterium]|nr:hypothetical protein [Candidatus Dormibacteraeota bacterium]